MTLLRDKKESILDWEEISQQIPDSNDPEGAIHLIKKCLQSDHDFDLFDQMNKSLNLFVENLENSFKDLNN